MRKVIMWNMVTLDGYFEGREPWDLDLHEYVWGEELREFSLEQGRTAGLLIFGRRTYEGMAAYWQTATGEIAEFMNRVPKVVLSKTLEKADWNNTRLVSDEAADEVRRLKQESGDDDIYIFGSADLCDSLMSEGLIDEYRIGLNPIVLGGGGPLFKERSDQVRMKLLEARPLSAGCVILRYAPL